MGDTMIRFFAAFTLALVFGVSAHAQTARGPLYLQNIPSCPDTGGNHLNYAPSSGAVSCGTTSSGGGGGSSSAPGTITGLDISVDGGSPSNTISVAPGEVSDIRQAGFGSQTGAYITLPSACKVNLSTTGSGGLDTGALANSTWYGIIVASGPSGTTCLATQNRAWGLGASVINNYISGPAVSLTTTTGSCPTQTVYVRLSYIGAASSVESGANNEASQAVSSDCLQVNSPPAYTGATAYNVYASTSANTETLQTPSPIPIGTNWVEPTSGLVTNAGPTATWGAAGCSAVAGSTTITLSSAQTAQFNGAPIEIDGAGPNGTGFLSTIAGGAGTTTLTLADKPPGTVVGEGCSGGGFSPTLPPGYSTAWAYVGSIKTTSTGGITPFACHDRSCRWASVAVFGTGLDIALNNNVQSYDRIMASLTVPLGVPVIPIATINGNCNYHPGLSSWLSADAMPSTTAFSGPYFPPFNGNVEDMTNFDGALGFRQALGACGSTYEMTYGWTDLAGAN